MVSASKPAQAQQMQQIQTWKLQNLQRSGLDWSGLLQFLHFLSLCRFWSRCIFAFFEPVQVLEPWMFKTCTGSKKCKTSKPGSSNTCTGSKQCKQCKTQMQCQRSGLDWSGLLHFLYFFEPVQVLRRPGLFFFLHFFQPVQVLEPWVLKTCTGSKNAKNPNLKAHFCCIF